MSGNSLKLGPKKQGDCKAYLNMLKWKMSKINSIQSTENNPLVCLKLRSANRVRKETKSLGS